MNIIAPSDKVTLLLNKYMEAFGVCTARSALRHLINGGVSGIDANDQILTWDGRDPNFNSKEIDPLTGKLRKAPPPNPVNWSTLNIAVRDDQPVLRSAPQNGHEKAWFIPTVVRCNRSFGYRVKGNRKPSLHDLFKIYKKTCQYCHTVIPFSEATEDHVYPRCRGGADEESNIVLACKSCNNQKDSQFPYPDIHGNVPKPRRRLAGGTYLPPEELRRPEWKKYLFLED